MNRRQICSLAAGKAAQPGLNQNELKSVSILIPSADKIQEFTDRVSPLMRMVSSNSVQNNKLVQLRDTLLPKLMRGEIDVSKVDISKQSS